jgi:hypothetical protein
VSKRDSGGDEAADLNSVLTGHPTGHPSGHPFREAAQPSERSWRPADPQVELPAVTAGEIVAASALVLGLAALDAVSGGLMPLAAIPFSRAKSAMRVPVVPADLHLSAAPALGADRMVACTCCHRRVAYASMAINEHGYFCDRCGLQQPAG